jgi:hypothetical protein
LTRALVVALRAAKQRRATWWATCAVPMQTQGVDAVQRDVRSSRVMRRCVITSAGSHVWRRATTSHGLDRLAASTEAGGSSLKPHTLDGPLASRQRAVSRVCSPGAAPTRDKRPQSWEGRKLHDAVANAESMRRSVRRPMLVASIVASITVMVTLFSASSALAVFGVSEFTANALNEDRTLDTQAGSHPYEAATSFTLNRAAGAGFSENTAGFLKDVEVELPVGFVGDPQATPQCPMTTFENGSERPCPVDTQVGEVTVTLGGFFAGTYTQPVYNLVPPPGHPAEFGFHTAPTKAVAVLAVASVNPAAGDRVVIKTSDIPTGTPIDGLLPVLAVSFTFWGVPADPAHDVERGYVCDKEPTTVLEGCHPTNIPSDAAALPFLTNPTNCKSGPVITTLRVDSWEDPGHYLTYAASSPQPAGCDRLTFHPTLEVTPETTQSDAPSGYTFHVKLPQQSNPYSLATPALETGKVTLPEGVSIDPSAANGLQGCTDAEIAIGTEEPVTCPEASKIGTVEVFTPLLADGPSGSAPLHGAIYLGTPLPGDEYRVFLTIEGHGISLRLEGSVSADPTTGRLTAVFQENPPLPFNDLVLKFFGGSEAALANPLSCTPATTTSDLTPYSAPESPDATPASTFEVTGCLANPAPFAPSLVAGTTSSAAGAYSPFTFQLRRGDGQQYISQVRTVSLPPGLLGNISAIPLCAAAEASAGTCGPLSQIGQVTVGAGPGPEPFYLPGKVYLTQGYGGDPFGLSVVVPAIAGPYNLGTVVVRAGISVDPQTAAITVNADPIPTILEGIPVRLRYIAITLDRPSFMFNPTSCARQSITASISSQQGATIAVANPFYVTACEDLSFAPIFEASTQGQTSKANGAALRVRIAQHSGEANIRKVDVQLPTVLPSRLTTLQKACVDAVFNANPASCPEGSNIGTATVHTPVLTSPLTGPAYLVSHGGAAFPDVEFVLQGEGITLILDGKTDIKKGITYSRFETVPDAPISAFELNLPEGPHSALAAYGSLCKSKLVMPTTIVAQNGATVTQSTQVGVSGCAASTRKLKLTSHNVKGKTLTVGVNVPAKGRISLSGPGLKSAKRTVPKGGTFTLRTTLTAKASKAFQQRRKLRIKVRAGYTPSSGSSSSTTATVTFR